MVCPYCLHTKTEVYNSRATKKVNGVWRRRRCKNCAREFTTTEAVHIDGILKVKGPKTQPFSRAKLLASLLKVTDHRADTATAIFYLDEVIEQKLCQLAAKSQQIIALSDVINTVADVLKLYDTIAYVKYIGYHLPPNNAAALRRKLQ